MNRVTRLRRVLIICHMFIRNLAYYRAAREQQVPNCNYWNTTTANNIDICSLEWCKLFGDKDNSPNLGEHTWQKIISKDKQEEFKLGLLGHLSMPQAEFEEYRIKMRAYRDNFIAHLDSELTMDIPDYETAKKSICYYYNYLAANEGSLVVKPADLNLYYEECVAEIKATILGHL